MQAIAEEVCEEDVGYQEGGEEKIGDVGWSCFDLGPGHVGRDSS